MSEGNKGRLGIGKSTLDREMGRINTGRELWKNKHTKKAMTVSEEEIGLLSKGKAE